MTLLQSSLQSLFKTTFKATETIAPQLANKWAIRLFFTPKNHHRPSQEERLLTGARIEKVKFDGFYARATKKSYYVTYRWGVGPTILLVHGWAGRGSQLVSLVPPLVEAGYSVITFDAPAHGNSPGKQTNFLEVAKIIKELEAASGGFDTIIGHSFGGVVAGYALNNGVRAQRLVTIGAPSTMEFVLTEFAKQIQASDKTVQTLVRYIEAVTQLDIEAFSLTYLAGNLDIPGLIIHDKNDRAVHYSQAIELSKCWPDGELILTEGLGHRRILNDADIIARIVDFTRLPVT